MLEMLWAEVVRVISVRVPVFERRLETYRIRYIEYPISSSHALFFFLLFFGGHMHDSKTGFPLQWTSHDPREMR